MDFIKAYHAVDAILNTVDFGALFAGFHKYRFALYNSKEIIIDGMAIPYREDFRGNTSKLYEGEYIAIWNMESDPVDDPEQLAYCLVHEMFHCHQQARHETRYPSDLALLNYPDDVENYLHKYNENRYLADACQHRDIMLLRKFACVRESRREKYPSMVQQEMKAETLEGMAEYIGLKALERINADKYNAIVEDYLGKLREESRLLFDARRLAYFTGTVFFLCLELLEGSVNNLFHSSQTAYEQNRIDTSGVTAEIHAFDFISSQYTALVKERELKIKEHIRHAKYTESRAVICGYDPMNMFRVGELIYCSHFVCLDRNGETDMICSPVVLKLAEGTNQIVVGYYVQ